MRLEKQMLRRREEYNILIDSSLMNKWVRLTELMSNPASFTAHGY